MALPLGALLARLSPYVVKLFAWLATARGLKWLGSLAVSVAVYVFFYSLFSTIITRVTTDMSLSLSSVSGIVVESATGSLLAQANYFFPVDLFATLCVLYASIWSGVFVFRSSTRIFNMLSNVAEKISGQ